MKPVTSFPFPSNGKVRFYVRTPQQIYMAEAEVTELTGNKHPLAPLFGAAMDLSTLLQNTPEGP